LHYPSPSYTTARERARGSQQQKKNMNDVYSKKRNIHKEKGEKIKISGLTCMPFSFSLLSLAFEIEILSFVS
jgi:hypothetical protein